MSITSRLPPGPTKLILLFTAVSLPISIVAPSLRVNTPVLEATTCEVITSCRPAPIATVPLLVTLPVELNVPFNASVAPGSTVRMPAGPLAALVIAPFSTSLPAVATTLPLLISLPLLRVPVAVSLRPASTTISPYPATAAVPISIDPRPTLSVPVPVMAKTVPAAVSASLRSSRLLAARLMPVAVLSNVAVSAIRHRAPLSNASFSKPVNWLPMPPMMPKPGPAASASVSASVPPATTPLAIAPGKVRNRLLAASPNCTAPSAPAIVPRLLTVTAAAPDAKTPHSAPEI